MLELVSAKMAGTLCRLDFDHYLRTDGVLHIRDVLMDNCGLVSLRGYIHIKQVPVQELLCSRFFLHTPDILSNLMGGL